jgi:hypothetical protein
MTFTNVILLIHAKINNFFMLYNVEKRERART